MGLDNELNVHICTRKTVFCQISIIDDGLNFNTDTRRRVGVVQSS